MVTRVLIVCDGTRFSFAPFDNVIERFTVADLVLTLKGNTALDVKTAHRRTDPIAGTMPDFVNFNFKTSVNLTNFDVLWLIGDEGIGATSNGSAIGDDELLALADFMDGGGGVFATGDHEGIGSQMCGRIPRVRTMRYWYWDEGDIPADVPPGGQANWPAVNETRADTVQPSTGGGFFFDGQSDHIPQPLTVLVPAHPILQVPSGVLNRYPDHMHEGEVVVPWATNGTFSFSGSPMRTEYRALGGMPPELPQILATGTVLAHTTENSPGYTGSSGGSGGNATVARPPLGILCAYDGRKAGVGRVVTDSSFHHLLDVNLIGDPQGGKLGGATFTDTHQGFNAVPDMLADMHAFFNNTVAWLARPVRALTFVVDKSTYGKDETQAHPMGQFDSALFVIVDGLTSADFPGGPINETVDPMSPTPAQLAKLAMWAPQIPSPPGTGITFTPIGLTSDDPALLARVQRFTFIYRVTIGDINVFNFPGAFKLVDITATLGVVPAPPAAHAQIELIKLADPYFSNYANGNTVGWLSSDLRVFHVIEGEAPFGMALGGTPTAARSFLSNAVTNMTKAVFDGLKTDETQSALSIFPTTSDPSHKKVFNFALARVRLKGVTLPADPTRVFFRIFQSPTTASLTYQTDMGGHPTLGYRQAESGGMGGHKISLLGISGDGMEYTSMPCFAVKRVDNTMLTNNMTTQDDGPNAPPLTPDGSDQQFFFGAFLDTNQTTPNLFPATPVGQANPDGPFSGPLQPFSASVMAGVHQCLGAEIVFDGAPIPNGSTPGNSDKLAQRNIAYTTVANPGTPSSRTAVHTFEVRPSPSLANPDELMIDWGKVPAGTTAALYLPGVSADTVVAMADKMYAAHGLKALDAHTLATPVGGITYVPLPSGGGNFAGLFTMDLPYGIVKGQRFDVAVRQITTKSLQGATVNPTTGASTNTGPIHPAPKTRAERAAIRNAKLAAKRMALSAPAWRRVQGAFQIAVPVSTKADMLVEEARVFSLMLWRARIFSANSRWYPVFQRYVEVLGARLEGLGGDPESIPPTPDGMWPGLDGLWAGKTPGYTLAPTDGGLVPHPHGGIGVTGKVDAILYDHFGDFEAFVVETEMGVVHRYDSREPRVLALVRRAWEERITVTVYATAHNPHRPLDIVLHGAWNGRP